MSPTAKKIAGSIAGIITALVVIMIFQRISAKLYPLPDGVDVKDMAQMEAAIATMPFGAVAFLLLSYILGSFAGGYTGSLLSRPSWVPALVVGIFLTVGGIFNLLMIKHPSIFWAMLLIYIPCSLIGARMAMRTRTEPDAA